MRRTRFSAWVQDLSIRYKLQLAILGTSSIAILLAGLAIAALQWRSASDSTQSDLTTLAQVMAANSTAAISFNDVIAAEENLRALRARPNVILACLFSGSMDSLRSFAEYRARASAPDCSTALLNAERRRGELRGQALVEHDQETLGRLLIIESDAALWAALRSNALTLSVTMLACLLVALLLSSLMQRLIASPILALAETAARISDSGDFSLRAPESGQDEIGALIRTVNTMLGQIESAERQLRELNADLEAQVSERNLANQRLRETLDQLRHTQDQLVQTEKMASLGGLVAGVAHEINTPVGIGVTAASTLCARARELRLEYQEDRLTAKGLQRFLDLAEQSTNIILSNLERAANLIQSFKQVAVDQSSLDHRRFRVREYTEEILLSLKPKLKHSAVNVHLECPADLRIDSYPGLYSQILTNLVMNSLIHAYEEGQAGTIRVSITPTDEGLQLTYSDDGKGIPPEHREKVFEPFFTTRRSAGGSGLGLHIVYNLVTQQLGGQISCESAPGKGTTFHIEIKSKAHARPEPLSRAG